MKWAVKLLIVDSHCNLPLWFVHRLKYCTVLCGHFICLFLFISEFKGNTASDNRGTTEDDDHDDEEGDVEDADDTYEDDDDDDDDECDNQEHEVSSQQPSASVTTDSDGSHDLLLKSNVQTDV